MNAGIFAQIGRRAPVLRLKTRTKQKVGKAGLPAEWQDGIFTEKTILVRVNFLRCPTMEKRLSDAGLPAPSERFLVPNGYERVKDTPLLFHPKTGKRYLWCVGEGVEHKAFQTAGGEDITDDPRLKSLLPSYNEVPNGMMSFVIGTDSILEMEEI